MMGLGIDGWATRGFVDNDTALLEYYGAATLNITANRDSILACKCRSYAATVAAIVQKRCCSQSQHVHTHSLPVLSDL